MKPKVLFLVVLFLIISVSAVNAQSLHRAAKDGNIALIEELIKKGEDVNSTNYISGWTPLMVASYYNHSRLVEYLLKNGANVNQKSLEVLGKIGPESTALHIASFYDFKESVKALLDNKADVNITDYKGRTALLIASYYGYTEIVRLLMSKGADPNIPDNSKNTALNYATKYSFTEIYELLTGKDIVTGKNTNQTKETSQKQPPSSVADELLKLKKLKDSGVLTNEEYELQKKKLLSR
jgi:uncharacterized protein